MKKIVSGGLTILKMNGNIRMDQLSTPGNISKKRYRASRCPSYGISISATFMNYLKTSRALLIIIVMNVSKVPNPSTATA